ncbi:GNAT family N-acetyltransferase [Streptomyces griseus]|uniref:GNAT family N-acetyltransferase n=1 Tax=Streptomyces TaxID=1883 RepID=UPI0037BC496B
MADVAALVEVSRDPALRQWAASAVDDDADGARWVQAQQRGWAAGDRFGFAVLASQPAAGREQLVGNVVLKDVAHGKPAAEVGYWTAAHARGLGVAPALWRDSPAGPSTPSEPTGWSVLNSCTRWTTWRRAGSRRRAGTTSTASCPRRCLPSPSMALHIRRLSA